ncbi:hypothetical protein EPK99_06465 [Neorhizobium lilium]|uniref:Uncharacterized protein n=1 Tax=Neorhizobium lilium TaxID=2503024 RepID=A0A3S3VNC9_9HYPH|nr:hypothetical protein [Neorhizobium lilium]RWX78272.1 hypothetical protein EPK99_06465 [Neorhizobium lilium]
MSQLLAASSYMGPVTNRTRLPTNFNSGNKQMNAEAFYRLATTMGRTIAETYAASPSFYSGTFCSTCRGHFPVGEDGEFTWYEMDGSEGPKVGV